jgi:hypothetical protein
MEMHPRQVDVPATRVLDERGSWTDTQKRNRSERIVIAAAGLADRPPALVLRKRLACFGLA